MRRNQRPFPPGAIIILRQIQKHQWLFELPRITLAVDNRLREGINWMRVDQSRAESIFRQLICEYPEYLDAYHHLALTLERKGESKQATQLWKQAVATALKFFPPHFSLERDQLAWGFETNRPFLRLYHAYGLELLQNGETEDALEVFENLLVLNPNDNQGVRALVVGCYFALKQPEGVLSVCRQYPQDGMEQLLYGRALALFQLGKLKQAGKALDQAIRYYPLIAKELLKAKHRKPKKLDERYVTHGGPDQAFLYWREHGKYWTETPGAIEWVRNQLPEEGTKKR